MDSISNIEALQKKLQELELITSDEESILTLLESVSDEIRVILEKLDDGS